MKILVRAVGKMRDRRLAAVCDEYVERARRHLPVEIGEVEDDAHLLSGLPAGTEIFSRWDGEIDWPALCWRR